MRPFTYYKKSAGSCRITDNSPCAFNIYLVLSISLSIYVGRIPCRFPCHLSRNFFSCFSYHLPCRFPILFPATLHLPSLGARAIRSSAAAGRFVCRASMPVIPKAENCSSIFSASCLWRSFQSVMTVLFPDLGFTPEISFRLSCGHCPQGKSVPFAVKCHE